MTDLHTVLPPPGRSNGTPLYDIHPDDHNVVVDAINMLHSLGADYESTIHMKVYANLTTMYADATQPEGTLGWTTSEGTLAVYNPDTIGWIVILERMHAFTPRAWIGTTELTLVPDSTRVSRLRQNFGYCWFHISARFGGLNTISGTGVLALLPPIAPSNTVAGPFQMAFAICPQVGAIGGISGGWDGTTVLTGAPSSGRLSLVMPYSGGLMDRGDMGPSSGNPPITGGSTGQFDVHMAGFYPILGFV